MKNNKLIYVLILAAIVCVTSCRKEEEIVPPTSLQVVYPDPNPGEIKGFFLLKKIRPDKIQIKISTALLFIS